MTDRDAGNPYSAPKSRGAGLRFGNFRLILYGTAALGTIVGGLIGFSAPGFIARYLDLVIDLRPSRLNYALTCAVIGLFVGGLLGAAVALLTSVTRVKAVTEDLRNTREEILRQARQKREASTTNTEDPDARTSDNR